LKLRIISAVFLFLAGWAGLSAQETPEILHRYPSGLTGRLELLPEVPGSEEVAAFFLGTRPVYGVEMLYRFPDSGPVDWRELSRRIRSISRLEEITYFSEHDHENKQMFQEAYFLESERSRSRLDDGQVRDRFQDETLYAVLDEVVLGRGTYKVDYRVEPDSLSMSLQTVGSLHRLVKLVDRGNLRIQYLFYEKEGSLYAYMFGGYTLENEYITRKVLKYPHSTLAKRMYTIFVSQVKGFMGMEMETDFPRYLRENL